MIVHIKKDDGTIEQATAVAIVYGKGYYDTEVFIVKEDCAFERVFAFKQGTKYIVPTVMYIDVHKYGSNWIKTDKMEGYKIFINNPKFLDKIRNGEKHLFPYGSDDYYSFESIVYGGEINYGPIYVDGQDEIDNLLEFTGWFHDALITDVKWNEQKTKLTLAFEGIWGIKKLFLHFSEAISLKLSEGYEYDYLYDASIFFEKGKICFVGAEDFKSMSEDTTGITTVTAKSLSYSFEYGEPEKGSRGGPEKFQ